MNTSSRSGPSSPNSRPLITNADDFHALCARLAQAEAVAFDTEFLSEASYRPQLCLLQFATADEIVAVDPLAVRDLAPWWELMADPNLLVIIHGGREEIRFCLREGDRTPRNLWMCRSPKVC